MKKFLIVTTIPLLTVTTRALFCRSVLQLMIIIPMFSDNHLQLDAQISIQGKKKSPGRRITGFQVVMDNLLCYFFHLHFFIFSGVY